MFSPASTGSSGSSSIKMLSKDPERYKAQGMADLATHVNDYKGPCRLFDNFDLEIMAKAFRNVLRADLQRVKALKEGVLHVIQKFEALEDWYIVPMTFEKMKLSNHRPFADIIGDMVKTGSIRITDAADLTVEEVLDDTRANNAHDVEENPCVAT
ncbi:uncharacterized protein Bfra_010217 [Botrytis fragariae]|uniref:Uncharacterized protein n=1 Tax=Botrytis fragariae TaxID=1964551 RepID=A0A8H6AMP5_9HELO|nr:uncharacterized protein Bfra_010217 [Botrytis fragariae]KAF5870070.1 hypothetical protein Bfra_010217 [Botrytis fragariae]